MTRRFLVRLEYDAEFKGYVASVPSLPGCMSQGKTEQEALTNIEDAIEGYLQVLNDTGQEIPQGDGEVYTVEVAA
jgi:predicted RNase H-like HicB family nuclease